MNILMTSWSRVLSAGGFSAIDMKKFNIGSWVTCDDNCIFMTRSLYSYAYIREAFFSFIHGLYFASIMASYAAIESAVYYLGEHYRFDESFIKAFNNRIAQGLRKGNSIDNISVTNLAKKLQKLGVLDDQQIKDFLIVNNSRQNIAHCKLFNIDCRDFNGAFEIMGHINEPRFRVGEGTSKQIEDECNLCLNIALTFLEWVFKKYPPYDCGPWSIQ